MCSDKRFFGQEDAYFEEKSCILTSAEIAGQPTLWKRLAEELQAKKTMILDFLHKIGDLRELRIVLTGAGSSAFVGEALAGFAALSAGLACEAIHTTDIVSAPETVLFPEKPTLLISFARSGNSPESVGAVQYARSRVKNLFEIAVVCDGTSELYHTTLESKNSLALVMPEGSCDKGFAMTSSVTCMLLAGYAVLNPSEIDRLARDIHILSENVARSGSDLSEKALEIAKKPFDRAVYLGSGAYKGLVHEGALKMMELSNGAVAASYDSAAGFRHGPKTVIKSNTITFHLISNNPFTAKYDIDLLNELYRERDTNRVFACCPDSADTLKADGVLVVPSGGYSVAADLCAGIHALVFFQTLSMYKSLELGVPTDNPSPGGQVNRVVKGVTVYPLV
ncbi:MAG: SIS domain-containing protein [Oscillospiraceae bacterium]|nr:SIS domain-containing protein [Oscillospiraceae bacterium]